MSLTSLAVSVAACAAVIAGTVAAAPAAQAQADIVVTVRSQSAPTTNLTKNPPGSTLGFAVIQTSAPILSQRWTMQEVEKLTPLRTAYRFVNQRGGCLDVQGKSTANGTRLVVVACDGSTSQQWIRDFSNVTVFQHLENRKSGLIATADGTASGSQVTQRLNISGANQNWVIGAV